jgi:hypothetical protein
MEPTRNEIRLGQIRNKIEMLYVDRGDDFNLPVRYQSLVTLEASLLELVRKPPISA